MDTNNNQDNKKSFISKMPKPPKTKVFRIQIHPLFLIVGIVVLFMLVGMWFNSGSNVQQISLDTFIREFQLNKYSSIQIRDNGEIVAQDKYIYFTDANEIKLPESTNDGQKLVSVPMKNVSLSELIEELKPKDAITVIRNTVSGKASTGYSEIIIGEDFIIALTNSENGTSLMVQGGTEDALQQGLIDRNLKLADLNVMISPLRSAASGIEQDSFEQRVASGVFDRVFSLDGKVFGRVSQKSLIEYTLKWDGGFNTFVDTLQQEGISLSKNNSVIVTFPVTTVQWGDIISLLTLIGFVVLGFVLFRAIQGSGSGLMRFGQTKARMFWGIRPDITFDDVAGVDEAKEELSEIVMFLKHPNKFRKLGARIPKGVLMVGSPGTGKTLMARAIAGEAGVPFFHTSGSEFEEMLVGAGASRVRDLFEKAKKASPSLIFIDEIDAVARKRGTTIQSGTTEQTLNQILVEMDGFEQNINVIVIAATNRPDVLDPAILRPGRFDRRVVLDLPDAEGRKKILGIHAANKPLSPKVSLDRIAKRTIGFSGAELENTLNEAAIIAAKRGAKEIEPNDIEEAASKVTMGPAKTSRKRDEYTLKLVAYHEAGHAVVSKFVPQANPVHRVSIIARGGAGGVTEFLPLDENQIASRTKLFSNLVVSLGGRAAEQVFMGDISTGASNDISQATNLAKNMVQKFGMSEKLGLIKYGDSDDLLHLGYGYGDAKDYSENTAAQIDDEVRKLIGDAYEKAVQILTEHKSLTEKLKDMLLDKEVVESEEFDELFEGVKGANPKAESRKVEESSGSRQRTDQAAAE